MSKPLMPKATAVWLVENTALTFEQIADFCSLHPLEVKGIADGDVAQGIKGLDPVATGQVGKDEIGRCEKDPEARLTLLQSSIALSNAASKKQSRYTPVSRRQERPDAIFWLLRNHPELPDGTIARLVGTTKSTIDAVRTRSHWNSTNLKAVDPVTLGLCSQIELDLAVERAARAKARAAQPRRERKTLRSAKDTIAPDAPTEAEDEIGAQPDDAAPDNAADADASGSDSSAD